jgi:hypothetical protein
MKKRVFGDTPRPAKERQPLGTLLDGFVARCSCSCLRRQAKNEKEGFRGHPAPRQGAAAPWNPAGWHMSPSQYIRVAKV